MVEELSEDADGETFGDIGDGAGTSLLGSTTAGSPSLSLRVCIVSAS